ncbi:cation diffusion facilitator family transporter [Thorsellia anophelis]|uniref:Cation-efflux pump FieF n=1 Tax=Thorsellia anophelis DSM 18579 TaxID=1123402 RepID=A0A1I0E2D0_9GAMM|nr:cation diffusion facilitator family transporter [Thorsellia anophelis]SET38880.1 ferrous-iron efflux pump FieF [Thorsellia anophelis DSM 18579]
MPKIVNNHADYAIRVKNAAIIATSVAILLFTSKLIVWWMTGSVTILAGLLDSLVDISASGLNLLVLRFALLPADDDHSFGHGKAESLAALAQGMFILGSAVFLMLNGIQNFISPNPIKNLSLGIIVIIFSLITTLFLVTYQRWVYKTTQSQAIRADMLHYQTDILMNFAILIALILSHFGVLRADAIFAIFISLYIGYHAIKIGYEAIQMLLDRALPIEEQEKILAIAVNIPGVLGAHDLKTRRVGLTRFIQMHIEMHDHLPLVEAHAITDNVEKAILIAYPTAEILLHQDPHSAVALENQAKKHL